MKTVIFYLKNQNENTLATQVFLGTTLIESAIKKAQSVSVDKIYIVGCEKEYQNTIKVDNIDRAFNEIRDHEGRTVILSPLYPSLQNYHIEALFKEEKQASVLINNNGFLNAYMLENKCLFDFDNIEFGSIQVDQSSSLKINNLLELTGYSHEQMLKINLKFIDMGINIVDVNNTYISSESVIGEGSTIYPNVNLIGKCIIGKNTTITSGSRIVNSEIGDGCTITSSQIVDSVIHNDVTVGPYAHLRMHCDIADNVRIGNFVEFKNTQFGKGSKCAHLTYLGDSSVGEGVNIGCGVVTVNYDGVHKYHTIIKDHAFIGSNANLIAPIIVGEYGLVAAGSTVTRDVPDGNMGIARVRQENKPDFGYKYINKEK